ncbi:MAG: GAF domain-containing protein [Planctomycetota bacterium]|nr:GAF domain-containing protein [Planctomycetota bacterium]
MIETASPSLEERQVLNHITMIVASGLSPQDLVRSVGLEIRKVIEFDRMSLTLYDRESDSIRIFAVIQSYESGRLTEGSQILSGDALLRPALEKGEPVLVGDIRSLDSQVAETLSEDGIISLLAYPLTHRRKVIGTINLASTRPNNFSSRQFDLLQQLAGPLAVALENARLWDDMRQTVLALEKTNQELSRTQVEMVRLLREAKDAKRKVEEHSQVLEDRVRERTHELTILKDLSDQIVGALNYDELFRIVLVSLHEVVNYDLAGAMLLEGDQHRYIVKRTRPTDRKLIRQVRDLILRNCKELSGNSIRVKDVSTSLRRTTHFLEDVPPLEGEIRSYINVPLVSGNELLGVINVSSLKENAFSQDHLRILYTISNQATAALLRLKTLREEEESRLRSMVAGMADGVILLTDQRRISLVNPAAEKMLGRLTDERLGDPLTRLGELSVKEFVGGVLSGEEPYTQTEVLLEKSGETFVIVAFPLKSSAGERVGAALILREVTRERSLQEQLIQAEKLSTVGQLVSGVAHELNNPLAGVIGYSQLLLTSECDAEIKGDLQKISREAERARRIVQNLLTFARRHKPEKTLVDINSIVDDTIEIRAYEMKVNNIVIVPDLDVSQPRTMADFHQLQQVFLNLINNAMDAMCLGGKGGTLTVRTSADDEHISIVVSDTGPGISKDLVRKVFDPFFTTKEVGKGTGLGLSIAYGIVQEHGGELSVDIRDGTSFTVKLPIIEEEVKKKKPSVGERKKPGRIKKRKILVADDEETIADLIANLLGKEGHEVDRALSGGQASKLLSAGKYDLIVSDVRMPGLGGKELYNLLADQGEGMEDRVVFITGDTSNPDTQKFLTATGAVHISKPFTLDELNRVIREVLTTL